jgi:hypothetical protein
MAMDNLTYGLGIGRLYGQTNPAERRVAIASKVAENSGLAKPFIYAMMGKDMAEAQEWDTEQTATIRNTLAGQQQIAADKGEREFAQKVLADAVKLSTDDPYAATDLLQFSIQAGGGNKYLKPFEGIKFTGKMKNNWVQVQAGDGQAYQVNVGGLGLIGQEQDPDKRAELTSKYVIPIGGPKPAPEAKAPKTRTRQEDTENVVEEWDSESGSWTEVSRGPRYKEKPEGESASDKAYSKLESQYRAAVSNLERDWANKGNNGMTEADYKRRADSLVEQFEPSFQRHGMSVKTPYERSQPKAKVSASTAPAGGGKPLDEATAISILKEAGGDKTKARDLARQRGYAF